MNKPIRSNDGGQQLTRHEAEGEYRSLVETLEVTHFLYVHDVSGVFTYVSPSVSSMLGYSVDEFCAHYTRYLTGNPANEEVVRHTELSIRGVRQPPYEVEIYHKDGSVRWLEVVESPVLDAAGRVVAVQGIAHDVTERRRTEERLREERDFSRALIDALPGLIYVLAPDGRVLLWNRPVEQVSGYSAEEIPGMAAMEFISPEHQTRADSSIREALECGEAQAQLDLRTKAGERVPYHFVGRRIELDGELRILGVATDLSERKRAEEALGASEQKLRSIINTIPYPIFAKDTELRYTECNTAFAEYLGLAREQIVGKTVYEVAPKDKADIYQRADQALLASAGRQTYEASVRFYDGTDHDVMFHKSVYSDGQGAPAGIVGIMVDITERKQVERQLQRLNRTLRLLSECNGALVQPSDERTLLATLCAIVSEHGGYAVAWVGFTAPEPETAIVPAAWSGPAAGFLDGLRFTRDETVHGRGPTGSALRQGRHVVISDFAADRRSGPWREAAQRFNLYSAISLPLMEQGHAFGVLELYSESPKMFEDETEIRLLEELASDLAYGIVARRTAIERNLALADQERSQQRLRKSLEDALQAIANTLESRDPYTAGHQRRVAHLCAAIARELGLPEDRAHGLHLAGVVHDIGKIQVPSEILAKPTRLTEIEFSLIKTHSRAGYDILKGIDFPWPIAEIVLQHHERLNGSGYPRGLKGDDILLEARIMAVADTVEAMASHRPYRPGLGIARALEEIRTLKGKLYDAAAVDACARLFEELGYRFPE